MSPIRISSCLLLLLLLPCAASAFDPWSDAARYEITYRADAAALPEGALRLWLPLPVDRPGQQELSVQSRGIAHFGDP